MQNRTSLSGIARTRGLRAGRVGSIAASIRDNAVALVGILVLAVATVQSCAVTRNTDGSFSATFAPDMVITAWGLEDALDQLLHLFGQCVAGTFPRECTDKERADIADVINKVLERKEKIGGGSGAGTPGG